MIKKTVVVKDLFDENNKQVVDLYFNLTAAELVRWLGEDPELMGRMENLSKGQGLNPMRAIQIFEDIMRRAYGERQDGKFVKTPQITESFMASEEYSEVLMELISDPTKAADFFNGMFPKELMDKARMQMNQQAAK